MEPFTSTMVVVVPIVTSALAFAVASAASAASTAQKELCFVSDEDFYACCCSAFYNCTHIAAHLVNQCCDPLRSECGRFGPVSSFTRRRLLPPWATDKVPAQQNTTPAAEAAISKVPHIEAVAAMTVGNPFCFPEKYHHVGYTSEHCCDTVRFGPSGDNFCWDGIMNFDTCCRAPKPKPRRGKPGCWRGVLEHSHEYCCEGSHEFFIGPRGAYECWERSARFGEFNNALLCCDFVNLGSSVSSPRCLIEGFASTCSYPGLLEFRAATLNDIFISARDPKATPFPPDEPRIPLLRSIRLPHPKTVAKGHAAELLTLGVGEFALAVNRIHKEALALGVFDKVHAYTDFSFLSNEDEQRWASHLFAWRMHSARIAGYGWWKPFLCRRHLADPSLPVGTGMLIYSDAGSKLELGFAPSWRELYTAMHFFDVMAVVETDRTERVFTKRRLFDRLGPSLVGTRAADDGQFNTRLFVLRKTQAVATFLEVWEKLVEEVDLVDESLGPDEVKNFRGHRHEQSVWSLLLKCAIFGRAVHVDPAGPPVNLSLRVLTLTSDYESEQFANSARSRV